MSKIETHPKAEMPASLESHDCCGGAAEPASKASNPAANEHPTPSTAAKTGCCCGGGSKTSKHPADPKR
jgi:hypothetical protein